MPAQILDGKAVAKAIKEKLAKEFAALNSKPKLVSFAVGVDDGTTSYRKSQKKQAEALGVAYEMVDLPESATAVPLTVADLVDLDLYWAFDLADPWGNRYELNTYDYDHVRVELVERDGVSPHRYWPADRYGQWRARRPRRSARAAPA